MVTVSEVSKDTEDTAPRVSVSKIHFKSIFPNPVNLNKVEAKLCQDSGRIGRLCF